MENVRKDFKVNMTQGNMDFLISVINQHWNDTAFRLRNSLLGDVERKVLEEEKVTCNYLINELMNCEEIKAN